MKSQGDKIKKNNKQVRKKSKLNFSVVLESLKKADPFVHVLIVAILLLSLFLIIYLQNQGTSKVYREVKKLKEAETSLSLKHNVYADHFVNDLGVNNTLSNFYLDTTTTAYTFIPDYQWLDKGSCVDQYCKEEPSDWNYAGVSDDFEVSYCIENNCLSLEKNVLSYNNKIISPPDKLQDKKIENISIYPLDRNWLIGFVYRDGQEERGRAYSFDGQRYIDLDKDDKHPFASLSDFQGARFGFGGDSDNYLVLYGGYKFLGYQVKGGKQYDISRFLGLRVSQGGFYPHAIKVEREDDTLWYLYSLEQNNPRFIKLWQNGSDSIKGSLSFTEPILNKKERASSFYLRPGGSSNDLDIIVERNKQYYRRTFVDNGFIQKDKYVLRSNNLLKAQGLMNEATFHNALVCGTDTCGANIPSKDLKFSLSGDGVNFFPLKFNKSMEFPESSSAFYWQIESGERRGHKNYSPWIDGLTDTSYSWFE